MGVEATLQVGATRGRTALSLERTVASLQRVIRLNRELAELPNRETSARRCIAEAMHELSAVESKLASLRADSVEHGQPPTHRRARPEESTRKLQITPVLPAAR
jgi:hypothetical protein